MLNYMELRMDQQQPLMCPRCDSTNTKFCYYNNYNKSQPRHFCRSCKKHWTKGGTLRNVNKKRKKIIKMSSKCKNKVGPTGKVGTGCNEVDEGLEQKMDDTQLLFHQKDESFGGISTGFDQSQLLFDNLGYSDDVGLRDGNVLFFDHEMLFKFDLAEVFKVEEKTSKDEVEDQLPCFIDHAEMDLKWEDVLEITQPWM